MLNQVITGKRHTPRRTVIYGVEGIGKTTFAAGAVAPIVIQTEDGVDHLAVPRTPLITISPRHVQKSMILRPWVATGLIISSPL